MSRRKFDKNDILINTLKANPRSEFVIYSSSIFYNNRGTQQGAYASNAIMTETGFINLYEYNIDKGTKSPTSGPQNEKLIHPYLSKDSTRVSLSMVTGAITLTDWETEFAYGDKIVGVYPQVASIKREYISTPSASDAGGVTRCEEGRDTCPHNYSYMSLRNILEHYGVMSDHYKVTSSFGNKDEQRLNLIHIPSIFYGNQIKPGTVSLQWYVTGTLISEVADLKQNGELIETGRGLHSTVGTNGDVKSGSVQGVVLYNEGFLLLTGSEQITTLTGIQGIDSDYAASAIRRPCWIYWGAGGRDGIAGAITGTGHDTGLSFRSASFGLKFEGETTTETMTLYARAHRGEVNFSNNPTFIKYNQDVMEFTSSHVYEENKERLLKNIVTSSFANHDEKFRRQVYISKIGVYDEQKNLIGIATLADPVLKDENEDYVFKLKLDM
jgi:hypothetical protein